MQFANIIVMIKKEIFRKTLKRNGMLRNIFYAIIFLHGPYKAGPSCSKLTMSLVNDSLKFKSSDMQIC